MIARWFFRYNIAMISRKDQFFALTASLVVLTLVIIPFVMASISGGDGYVFSGFLINPLDGNSYLAKMYQGLQGSWRFTLPFTAEAGQGAYLFLFYLGLGHFARVTHLPLLLVFHLARIFGCLVLLWSLWFFFGVIFDRSNTRKFAFALASLGAGMGWLLLPAGVFTMDFWVAETYPFLSSYGNPHFPLGLALVLWLVVRPLQSSTKPGNLLLSALGAFCLSLINPFGVVVVLMILAVQLLWQGIRKSISKRVYYQLAVVAVFGLPFLVYDLWVANMDPVLRGWNAQNLTPSPPIWDLAISLPPPLLLSIGVVLKYRTITKSPQAENIRLLIIWALFGVVLAYLPLGLQRRFLMGLYVPFAGLAALGVEFLARGSYYRRRILGFVFFLLAIPTNLIVLLTAKTGIETHDPILFLTAAENETLAWIEENTDPNAIILCSPEMGLFVPAYTGRRVLYGHPFETINAREEELMVRSFYKREWDQSQIQEFIEERGISFVLDGPRERRLGSFPAFREWKMVFSSEDVRLYDVNQSMVP